MFRRGQDHAERSNQIKQEDKFYSRLLSKETSMANPSFRVYYGGGAGAVPFMWESQPGTPKCSFLFNETTLPPLTPPPSYYFNNSNNNKKPIKKNSRSNNILLHTLFPKTNNNVLNKKSDDGHVSSTSPSSSSSSLSSNSSSSWSSSALSMVVPISSPNNKKNHDRVRSRLSSIGSSFDFRADYEEADEAIRSPTSTLWFSRIKGCYGQ